MTLLLCKELNSVIISLGFGCISKVDAYINKKILHSNGCYNSKRTLVTHSSALGCYVYMCLYNVCV